MYHGASYVDARGGTFSHAGRDQINYSHNFDSKLEGEKQCYPRRLELNVLWSANLHRLLAPLDNAAYNQGRRAKCLRGTREALIAKIEQWMDDGNDRPICWLSGPAGCGKSTVSQTVAERYDAENRLATSFFFSREVGDQSTVARLIPTLAYQLSSTIPNTKPLFQLVLQNDPSIIHHQSISYQLNRLIIAPLLALKNLSLAPIAPMVIVIDALDECDDMELMAEFIEALVDACRENQYFPCRFFITSRIEEHLRKRLENARARSAIYPLDLTDFDTSSDIHKFFQSRFSTIYEENRRLMRNVPLPWPSGADLEALEKMASGSFIFALTLINFINDGSDLPYHKLPIALKGHAGIDLLYTQVLSAAPYDPNFQQVIGTIMLLTSPMSITSLGHLLHLETADILHALLGIQSILMIPSKDNQPIQLLHTSLQDFLGTKSRSNDFFINPPIQHLYITIDCLKIMAIPPEIVFHSEAQQYACYNWCYHFGQALAERRDTLLNSLSDGPLMGCLQDFVSQAFDSWFNTLVLYGWLQEPLEDLHFVVSELTVSPVVYPLQK